MDSNAPPTPIVLTMGEPSGIGPEIVLKACALWPRPDDLRVVGDPDWLASEAARLRLPLPAHITPASRLGAPPPRLGEPDARSARAAYDAIVLAARMALAGQARAIVTAPISKIAMKSAGLDFPGHTELLAELAGAVPVRMMLANPELRVVLATIHLSLRQAIALLDTPLILQTVQITDQALRRAGIARPRIAVAGLNPHAGEGGLFGTEDMEVIEPAVSAARALGLEVSGPYPPDTIFMRARGLREFDVVIAMTHDHGLIPIKYLGLDAGVNVTLGLPFVRTSPDHGTAFDIAGRCDDKGRGLADPASMLAAIALAENLSRPQHR